MAIIETKVLEQGVLDLGLAPERGGRLRQFFRRVCRRLGLMEPAPRRLQDLFAMDMVAFRFLTDDGRACIVPMCRELLESADFDAEAEARRLALIELKEPDLPT